MIGFAALRWVTIDPAANRAAHDLHAVLEQRGWRSVIDAPGWRLLADPRTNVDLVRGGAASRTIVIGHLFDRRATEQSRHAFGVVPDDADDFADLCTRLVETCWGAYAAIEIDPAAPDRVSLFRDPIGMMECVTWAYHGVRIATSVAEVILPLAMPDGLGICWATLAQLVRFPGGAGETLPLDGVTALDAGCLFAVDDKAVRSIRLWSPADAARRRVSHPRPPRDYLPDLIDATLGAWGTRFGTAIAELSGGLDSAIVAAGLSRCRPRADVRWFHYVAPDPQGDERVWARATATQLALPVEEIAVGERSIDAAVAEALPFGLRPSVASLSLFHDRDLAERGRALGASCLYTGHGGDALFYQFATPSLAGDIWRGRRSLGTRLALTQDLARWTGCSVWSVSAAALADRRRQIPPPDPHFPLDLVARDVPRRWPALSSLEDALDLPPSKQIHILQFAAARAVFAPTWTNQAMTVVHPLLSQPIVEHALALSALDLTQARRDRALIREAYAHRLPAILVDRRGKGSITAYYGRMLARSVDVLRAYLLDGVLMGNGILDRAAVERVLDEDAIMLTNVYAEIFAMLFAERWARGWLSIIASARAS
ncbi:hypothetical protein HL653_23345 [Sphingomonas sp. AP4-R1]|uniref:asparagine synthase-related protein n=1 Tax=Sphingomonas sp. AP4-R1 TaxID=2735134 RepID=UPI001493D5E4|nr:asparagine synthetase B family protein [Sphingomonas sp. AP4-R1]QJU60279.1 hypothetical protein HL653_23345 [Sphingomonas sp. AP4-R1]